MSGPAAWVDVCWIPVGAGSRVAPTTARWYERVAAHRSGRTPQELFHAALVAFLDGQAVTVEMAPAWGRGSRERGVVAVGPVGLAPLGRLRVFRYEVRCWRGGVIPDLAHAAGDPVRMSTDPADVRGLLAAVPRAPLLTWGRDEAGVGDMWNSNSLVAWSLATAGLDPTLARTGLPAGGRAPGWRAGLAVAARQAATPEARHGG